MSCMPASVGDLSPFFRLHGEQAVTWGMHATRKGSRRGRAHDVGVKNCDKWSRDCRGLVFANTLSSCPFLLAPCCIFLTATASHCPPPPPNEGRVLLDGTPLTIPHLLSSAFNCLRLSVVQHLCALVCSRALTLVCPVSIHLALSRFPWLSCRGFPESIWDPKGHEIYDDS